MADIETSIGIGLDTSNALAAIKNLQKEISAFHTQLAKGSSTAAASAAGLQKDLLNSINATGQFSASLTRVKSTTEAFTNALEKNKFSMGEYFRYAGGASKKFGQYFEKEFDTVNKVARERVKDLQTQYIQLGRDATGAMQAMKIRPMLLDLDDLGTKTQIAAQRQQIFNQLLKQGSTNLLNFGKNTQWAGRQLMVGFTIPLSIFGSTAAKTFMELEQQAIRFRRVYGELFTSPEETDSMVKALQDLSLEFTKYGVAVEKTMSLAADAAAMGKTGTELLAQVTEANRLAVLGNVEQAQALETTISVTNAFGVAATDLANKIDFLNAVENQTVTSIEDLTIAIPKAGPVVQQLGGNVEDLAFFLTAMKEGGINASEGANALKSGLASLINPTGKASAMLQSFGINIQGIVQANKGDVKGLVIDFAKALDTLDPLNRAQAIEQLFGKFQFSRLSTLFQNVIAEGTQAERVLELTNATVEDLAKLSEKELGNVAEATTFKFQKAVEELRVAIAPIGEQFLKAVTPILEFATDILNKFNSLNDGVKNFVVIGGALIAGLGPVFLMTFGLIANGVANIIKGFASVRGLFLKTKDSSQILGEQLEYMTQEQINAASVASSLERVHQQLEQRFTSEAQAVKNLVAVYQKAIAAKAQFSTVPGISKPGMKLANGIVSVPGPKGAGDIIPAMLSPGEAVIPADMAKKYAPLISGMISNNIPGFADGLEGSQASNMPKAIASHWDLTAPQNLAKTLNSASRYISEGAIELFTVMEKTSGEGYEVVREMADLADVARSVGDEAVSMFSGGQFYAGTAAVGPSDRNEMFNRLGIAGEPFRLDSLIEAASKAEVELNSGSETSKKWNAQLQELVDEGTKAKQLLQQSNDQAAMQIDYMRSNAKKTIEEGLLADKRIRIDGRKLEAADASIIAERRLLEVDKKLAELKATGITKEQLVQEAQDMLIAKMQTASTGQYTIGPATGYGPKAARDATRNMIRSSGPQAVERPDFKMPYRGGMAVEVANKTFAQLRADGESLVVAAAKAIASGAKRALKIASPSKEMGDIGANAGKSLIEGAKGSTKNASAVGKQLGDAIVQSASATVYRMPTGRRVTTDQGAYLQAMQAQISSIVARGAQTQNRFVSSDTSGAMFASDLLSKKLLVVGGNAEEASSKLDSFGNKAMNASFALSSIAAVSSMFGQDLGWLSEAIYGITTAMFALTGIVQLLSTLEAKRAALAAKEGATTLLGSIGNALSGTKIGKAFTGAGGMAALKTGSLATNLSNLGTIVKAVWLNMGPLAQGLLRLVPVVGLSVAAFSIASAAIKENRAKIDYMGKAAFAAGEKLNGIANVIGFDPIRNPADYGQNIQSGTTGTSVSEQINASQLAGGEALNSLVAENGAYYAEFEGLKQASLEEAGQQMTSLMNQLIALSPEGTDISKIREFVIALANKAGKEGITLGIAVNPYADPQTFNTQMDAVMADLQSRTGDLSGQISQRLSEVSPSGAKAPREGTARGKQVQNQFGADARQIFNETASAFEQLRTALGSGAIGLDEFNTRSEILTANLKTIPSLVAGPAMNEMIALYGIDGELVSGITNLTNKLALLQALQMGAQVDPAIIEALDAADNPNATKAEKDAGAQALIDLEKAKQVAITDTINASKKLAEQNIKTQASVDLSTIEAEITQNEEILEMAPKLVKAGMDEADAYDALTDAKWQNIFASAKIKDLEADPTGKTTTNIDAAIAAYKNWKTSIDNVADANEKATALKNFNDYVKDLEKDRDLKKELEGNSELAADAQLILNEEMLKSAYYAAMANGTLDQFLVTLGKYKELAPAASGGTPEKTPFEQAIEQLKDQRKEILNTFSAFAKLKKAGIDTGKAFRIAKDPILAAALAAEKVGTKKWKELVALINKVNAETAVAELRNLTNENIAEADATANLDKISTFLKKIGYDAQEVETVMSQIGDNPDIIAKFVADIKDGKVNAQSIRDYLSSVKNIRVKLSIEDMEADVNKAFSDISEAFAAIREQINLDFETGTNASGKNEINPLTGLPYNINEIKKSIKDAQDYIAERQYKIDDEEYLLQGIQDQEEKINEKYEDRISALDKVNNLNEQISQQQKSQLTLADALSQGDIAAAARAAQEMQDAQASKSIEDQKTALNLAKESELANVRATDGRTRVQIETNIKNLKDEILKKEEEILEPQERALDLAEGYRDAANSAVAYLGKNETEWKKIENGVRLAKVEAQGYKKAIEDAIALIPQLNAAYAGLGTPGGGGGGNGEDPKQTRINQLNSLIEGNRNLVNGADGLSAAEKKAMSQNVSYIKELRVLTGDPTAKGGYASGGLVKPKYFSVGGMARGTDTVPAMLTPGEFVVRKYAVDNFGVDNLKAINSGTYAGGSLYNYSVNVNVQTNADPNQIAGVVMTKIRQIDSQRIRGNRF